jgi:hypothetical protein
VDRVQTLAATAKESFFTSVVPVVNTLNAHFVGAGDQLFFHIDVPIVETIIRKLLFDPDACLQKISELLKRTWALSVAFDSSTIQATNYFDVRVRFAADAELHCFQMLALPLHGSHTGQLVFDVFKQAMDAIIPGWEDCLLSTCSDGARNMLGVVVTAVAIPKAVRVLEWSGYHLSRNNES